MTTDGKELSPAEKADRALWRQARDDYDHALAISISAWKRAQQDGLFDPDCATLQAGTATVLIHLTKLRESSHRAVAQPNSAVTAAAKRGQGNPEAPASAVAVPPCPRCGGQMWDQRPRKKNPKGPDFKCKDKTCVDPESGYVTAMWERDLKKNGAKGASSPKPTESYDEMPAAMGDANEDDLPF